MKSFILNYLMKKMKTTKRKPIKKVNSAAVAKKIDKQMEKMADVPATKLGKQGPERSTSAIPGYYHSRQ